MARRRIFGIAFFGIALGTALGCAPKAAPQNAGPPFEPDAELAGTYKSTDGRVVMLLAPDGRLKIDTETTTSTGLGSAKSGMLRSSKEGKWGAREGQIEFRHDGQAEPVGYEYTTGTDTLELKRKNSKALYKYRKEAEKAS